MFENCQNFSKKVFGYKRPGQKHTQHMRKLSFIIEIGHAQFVWTILHSSLLSNILTSSSPENASQRF